MDIMDRKEKQPSRCTAHAIEYKPSTATWFLWLHVMRKHSLDHLVVTGKVEGGEREGVKD